MKIDRFNIGQPRPHPDSTAVDSDGKMLPLSPEQVTAVVERAIRTGDLLAAVIEMPDGDLSVQVFGPPSLKTLESLERAARSYRAIFDKKNIS